ncbi:MAG: hypothetical protein K2K97_05075 [Muribaculaceae bacterium]|nr:hypothetical protein [Muribaculaceae bacterium]
MKRMLLLLCATIILFGCNQSNKVTYSEFVAFGSDGWDPMCTVGFSPYPMDSVVKKGDKFNLILTLRYTAKDLTQVIPLEITEEDENGVIRTERRSIRLCDKDGDPTGNKGIALYEISDTLHSHLSLPDGYSLSIQSLSPPENTLCLRNLGITLVRSEKKE